MLIRVLHGLTTASRGTNIDFVSSFGQWIDVSEIDFRNIHYDLPSAGDQKSEVLAITYEVLAARSSVYWPEIRSRILSWVEYSATVYIFPQDDYTCTQALHELIRTLGQVKLFTPIERDFGILYQDVEQHLEEVVPVLTGYLTTSDAGVANPDFDYSKRSIDYGNRIRSLPIIFGSEARLKSTTASRVARAAHDSGLKVDFSTDASDALGPLEWHRFLENCRHTATARGGATVADLEGKLARSHALRRRLGLSTDDRWLSSRAPASDIRTGDFTALGPRFFDAILAGTCQILARDEYLPGFEAELHYIPLDRTDDSLLRAVSQMQNPESSAEIARRALSYVTTLSGCTYRDFVLLVMEAVAGEFGPGPTEKPNGVKTTSIFSESEYDLSVHETVVASIFRHRVARLGFAGRGAIRRAVLDELLLRMGSDTPSVSSLSGLVDEALELSFGGALSVMAHRALPLRLRVDSLAQ